MLLEVKNISSGYGDVTVLSGASMGVRAGEIVSLAGVGGSGKTTLIRTILGTLPASEGEIRFNGRRIDGLEPHRIARAGIAQVMEGRRLFGHMEVEDNLLVGGDVLNDKNQQRENLQWIYDVFPRLKEVRGQLARSCGSGEQQMLAIGRALMTSPKLLLLDEPSDGLAPAMAKEICGQLPMIRDRGVAIVLVERGIHRSAGVSERRYLLEHGEIVMSGAGRDIRGSETPCEAYLDI